MHGNNRRYRQSLLKFIGALLLLSPFSESLILIGWVSPSDRLPHFKSQVLTRYMKIIGVGFVSYVSQLAFNFSYGNVWICNFEAFAEFFVGVVEEFFTLNSG
ncbi:hypothetical protein P8452_74173 [Trifolium repens]|nr:hypothetical protein P8452_74173 [Trifolium repens]